MQGDLHVTDAYKLRWMEAFRQVCDETWHLTTFSTPTEWLTFRKLWNWKQK